jgi:hypothetical protein
MVTGLLPTRTVRITDVHSHHAPAFMMLNKRDMRQCTRDTIGQTGQASAPILAAGALGLSENRREQALIAGFPSREQSHRMLIGEPRGCIRQQPPEERLIAPPLDRRHHPLAGWGNDFGCPLRMVRGLGLARSCVTLNAPAPPLAGLTLVSNCSLQPLDTAWLHVCQTRRRLQPAAH